MYSHDVPVYGRLPVRCPRLRVTSTEYSSFTQMVMLSYMKAVIDMLNLHHKGEEIVEAMFPAGKEPLRPGQTIVRCRTQLLHFGFVASGHAA